MSAFFRVACRLWIKNSAELTKEPQCYLKACVKGLCSAGFSLVGELALDHQEHALELAEDVTVGGWMVITTVLFSPGQQAQGVHDEKESSLEVGSLITTI